MRHDNLDCFSWFYSKSWDKLLNTHLLCDYEEKTHVTLHIFRSAMLNAYDIPQWQLSAEPLINWSYCLEFGKKTSIRQHFPVIFHQFPQSPLIKMLSNLKSRRLQLADQSLIRVSGTVKKNKKIGENIFSFPSYVSLIVSSKPLGFNVD